MTEISIDIGSVLPYLEEKLLGLFKQDSESRVATDILRRHARLAIRDSSTVQIVGMDRPVAITDIYQPTRLRKPWRTEEITFDDLVQARSSAVILGRPGAGKTVLLHYIFASLSRSPGNVPVLFTLRRSETTEDLVAFVAAVAKKKLKVAAKRQLILLVDGYDEVSSDKRKLISEALREYQSLKLGPFYLTCRSYYPVDDTGANHYEIAPFTRFDAERFLVAFGKAYGAEFQAKPLLEELSQRGFDDFILHPLMLALVGILKAGAMPALPRTAIGILRRAVDTLTFRWDESKGVARETKLSIDGEDRVRCMMRIAFVMKKYSESDTVVQHVTRDYLKLLQRPELPADRLLAEIAQWYGMLIPVADESWTFAHRTVHDFLAARYWVESGTYAPSRVNTWNARAAYAACLIPDATGSIIKSLEAGDDIGAFIECLYNNARFDVMDVSEAIVKHLIRHRGFSLTEIGEVVRVETRKDFYPLASNELLISLIDTGLSRPSSPSHAVVIWLSLGELARRGTQIPTDLSERIVKEYGRTRVLRIRRGDLVFKASVEDLVQFRGA